MKLHADPQTLDQKSNVLGSVFLWLNIALNLKGKRIQYNSKRHRK